MKKPDILLAITPVIRAFDELSVPYYLGGSIASSVHGIARATMDADIVADMRFAQEGSQRYVFRYRQGQEDGVLETLSQHAKDERTDFDWFDAELDQFTSTGRCSPDRP